MVQIKSTSLPENQRKPVIIFKHNFSRDKKYSIHNRRNVHQNLFALNNYQICNVSAGKLYNSKYLTKICNILISTEYTMGGVFV